MSRLAEMIVCDQVVKCLEENGLLHERIHGYRKYHGYTSSIIEVYEEALDAQERQELCSLNLYDQSAAFDLVDHELLMKKMSILGFDEDALGWYKEFLSGRNQYVHLEGADSELADVGAGAPQGSTNGPIVWLIYTIDLPLVIEEDLITAERDSDLILDALPAAPSPDRPSLGASDEPNLSQVFNENANSDLSPPPVLNTCSIPAPLNTVSPTPVPLGTEMPTPVPLGTARPTPVSLSPASPTPVPLGTASQPPVPLGTASLTPVIPSYSPPPVSFTSTNPPVLPSTSTPTLFSTSPPLARLSINIGVGSSSDPSSPIGPSLSPRSRPSSRKEVKEGKEALNIYADDVMGITTAADKTNLKIKIEDMTEKIKVYCKQNKLKMNENKTHFMTILSPQKSGAVGEMEEIEYGGKKIVPSKCERALGVIVSNTLGNWGPHVNHVISEAARKFRALKEGGNHFFFKKRVELVKSIYIPTLLYGLEVWGGVA